MLVKTAIRFIIFLAATLLCVFVCQPCCAQSTFDLVPPTKKTLPTYACAEASQNGTKIKYQVALSRFYLEELRPAVNEEGIRFKEIVQTEITANDDEDIIEVSYQVSRPEQYTAVEDGKEVLRTRTKIETRTRKMTKKEAKRMRAGGVPKKFKVLSPITKVVFKNGKPQETKAFQWETRTAIVGKGQKLVEQPSIETFESNINEVSFYKVDGTELDRDQAIKQLAIRAPVLLVPRNYKIEPFFKELVRPDTILIFDRTWTPVVP